MKLTHGRRRKHAPVDVSPWFLYCCINTILPGAQLACNMDDLEFYNLFDLSQSHTIAQAISGLQVSHGKRHVADLFPARNKVLWIVFVYEQELG